MTFRSLIISLLACLLLAACGWNDMLEKFSRPQDRALAQGYIDMLRAHDFAALEKSLDPGIRDADSHSNLVKLADLLPTQAPEHIKLVGAIQQKRVMGATEPSITTEQTSFQYDYRNQWLLISVVVKTQGDAPPVLLGLHITILQQPLEELNRFTLVGKGVVQYAVLAGTAVALLLTVHAFIACIRTPMPRRKWLWLLFIAVGFCQISVNWTTGAWSIQPLSFLLLSAGAWASGPYAPWVVVFAIPLGALIFLFYKRPRLRAAALAASAPSPVAPEINSYSCSTNKSDT